MFRLLPWRHVMLIVIMMELVIMLAVTAVVGVMMRAEFRNFAKINMFGKFKYTKILKNMSQSRSKYNKKNVKFCGNAGFRKDIFR